MNRAVTRSGISQTATVTRYAGQMMPCLAAGSKPGLLLACLGCICCTPPVAGSLSH